MTNDAFTRWDGVPFSDDVTLTVMLRSGKTITSKACDLDWSGDIVAYKILEKITPEDFGAVADPKGHPNASILMEIAKEAAVNNEYWKEFEWLGKATPKWMGFSGESDFLQSVSRRVHKIRRKPRTIRIGNYDVPEPMLGLNKEKEITMRFESEDDAMLMLKALQELLGKK